LQKFLFIHYLQFSVLVVMFWHPWYIQLHEHSTQYASLAKHRHTARPQCF